MKYWRVVSILHVTLQETRAPTVNCFQVTQTNFAAKLRHMFAVNNGYRVSKVRILALHAKQTAVPEKLGETGAEVSESRTARSLKRAIVGVGIANVLRKRSAGAAGAADATVKDADLDLRQAEAEFI